MLKSILFIFFCFLIIVNNSGCTAKKGIDFDKIGRIKSKVGNFIDKKITPNMSKFFAHVNMHMSEIFNKTGAFFSDIYGDPADNKESYIKLEERCPKAIKVINEVTTETGISPNYLLVLAYQESSCDPRAKASNSSAAGMFQFVELTWFGSIKKYGHKYGYEKYSNIILPKGAYSLTVKDPAVRQEILDLRFNARLAALMAAELAFENNRYLKRKLRRKMSATDLYLAHFFGAHGAYKFLHALGKNPRTKGVKLFPSLAKYNKEIFYSRKSGKPKSLRDIYTFFKKRIGMVTEA